MHLLDTCYNMDEPKKFCKRKKLETKDHILFDSISIRCPEKAWLFRDWQRGIKRGIFRGYKNSPKFDCSDHNTMNYIKILYTIVVGVNCIACELYFHKIVSKTT